MGVRSASLRIRRQSTALTQTILQFNNLKIHIALTERRTQIIGDVLGLANDRDHDNRVRGASEGTISMTFDLDIDTNGDSTETDDEDGDDKPRSIAAELSIQAVAKAVASGLQTSPQRTRVAALAALTDNSGMAEAEVVEMIETLPCGCGKDEIAVKVTEGRSDSLNYRITEVLPCPVCGAKDVGAARAATNAKK